MDPGFQDITEASGRIRSVIHRTPVFSSSAINRMLGATLFFKCENFQKAGAFKFRGASHAVITLDAGLRKKGVATHSSGNHAAALALAAAMHGIPVHIVMPENAPRIKKLAVAEYGARIYYCSPTLAAREQTIIRAMRMIWERMKIIVEPSAALPLAIVMEHPGKFKDRTVGIILSGGNVDLDHLPF